MNSSAQPGFATAGAVPGDLFERPDPTFPRLPTEMVDRVTRYGHPETFDGGAYLYSSGERGFDFFLVLDGTVDALENDRKGGNVVLMTYGANQFSGELNLFSDRAALLSARTLRPTQLIHVPRASFRRMVSAEPDLGEIILRAYILRRIGMIRYAEGGTVLVGCIRSTDTLRVHSFLIRNGYPHRLLDTDKAPDATSAIESFHLGKLCVAQPRAETLPLTCLPRRRQKIVDHPATREQERGAPLH